MNHTANHTAARFTLLLALVLTPACRSSEASRQISAPGTLTSAAGSPSQHVYVEGRAALERFRNTRGCDNAPAAEILAKLTALEHELEQLRALEAFPEAERETRHQHATLAFAFADEAVQRGCFDAAEFTYHNLLEVYPGNEHAAIRDRATHGLEILRSVR